MNIFAFLESFSWFCSYFNKKPSKCHLDFDYFIFAEKWTFSTVLDYQKWEYQTVTGAPQ